MSSRPPQPQTQDVELIAEAALGNQRAFAALYDRHGAILLGLLVRILRDRSEAEDVLQEVFLQAWQQATSFDGARGRPSQWLMMIARSRALDRLRARDSRVRTVAEASREATEPVRDTAGAVIASEEGLRVRRALEAVPAAQRQVLRLAYFGGLTQTEIAATLDRPLGTVKTQIRLGLMKLRERLRADEEAG
ncbi:MAG: sigma-70 family RNA polymerase sigma factor [Candidatus Binatia bacterium]